MYPNYVYHPQQSNKDKDSCPKNKKAKGICGDYELDADSDICLVLPFPNAPYTSYLCHPGGSMCITQMPMAMLMTTPQQNAWLMTIPLVNA